MKITLNELVGSVDSLKALLECKLPFKVSYRINKLLNNSVASALKSYEADRVKLVLKYGTVQEDGSTQVTDADSLKDFTKQLQELLDSEVEIKFDPISISEIGEVSIEPRHVLPWIFQD